MASSQGTQLNLGLPSLPETRNPELFPELVKVYAAINNLAFGLEAYTGITDVPEEEWPNTPPTSTVLLQNMSRAYFEASEDIPAGFMVNIWKTGGKYKIRKASSGTPNKHACGFMSHTETVLAGEFGEITMLGLCGFYSGLTGDQIYYLTDSGVISPVKPTTTGHIVQALGFAVADNILMFNPTLNITVV